MLTLTLFRHAKSSWDHPGLADFSRPLSDRGLTAAPVMARYLADHCWTPDTILCSTAQRTRQTLELATPFLHPAPTVHYEDDLYLASASELLARVRAMPNTANSVMVIGHNPGFHDLAVALAGSGDLGDLAALKSKFPTAGMARLTFEADQWSNIAPRLGHLTGFVTPSFLQMGRASV